MTVPGADFLTKKLSELLSKTGIDLAESREQFGVLANSLRKYSESSGGEFIEKARHRQPDTALFKTPFPFSSVMPDIVQEMEKDGSSDAMANVCMLSRAIWNKNGHQIEIDLNEYLIYMQLLKYPEMFRKMSAIGPVWAECTVRPKKRIFLILALKDSVFTSGPTGKPNLGVMGTIAMMVMNPIANHVIPEKVKSFGYTAPDTYFCQFDDLELDRRFFLRSSSVSTGRLIAGDPTFRSLISSKADRFFLSVGEDPTCDSSFLLRLFGEVEPDPAQFQIIHKLMERTLELLRQAEIIE